MLFRNLKKHSVTVAGGLGWWDSSVASENGILRVPLTGMSASGGSYRRMRCDKRLYFHEVTSRGF